MDGGVGNDSIVKAGETVTADTRTETDGEGIKYNYTDAQGRHAMVPVGFKVSTKASEQYIDDGLVIQDEDGNEFVWVPCYYGEKKPEGTADDVQQYKSHTYEKNDDTGDVTVENNGTWITLWYTKFSDWKDEASETDESYGNASVKKYGGFYIARYEAGWEETTTEKLNEGVTDYITGREDVEKKRNISTKKPISKPNVFAWNFIKQPNAKKASEIMYSDNPSVQSKLVDGTAWDTITNWIATGGVDVTDSTLYGNYNNTNKSYTGWYAEHVYSTQVAGNTGGKTGWLYARHFTTGSVMLNSVKLNGELWNKKKNNYTDTTNVTIESNNLATEIEIPTGSCDDFKLKNIYDLAGNVAEWTTEVGEHATSNDSSAVVFRGGFFGVGGHRYPLCCRNAQGGPNYMIIVNIGFRVVLYIK